MSNLSKYQEYGDGLEAAGGATATVLPWVGAGISAAGLLSKLYGDYKAQDVSRQNYEEQKAEFRREQEIMAENSRQSAAQIALQNQYSAKTAVDNDSDRSLARYQNYFRGIGL